MRVLGRAGNSVWTERSARLLPLLSVRLPHARLSCVDRREGVGKAKRENALDWGPLLLLLLLLPPQGLLIRETTRHVDADYARVVQTTAERMGRQETWGPFHHSPPLLLLLHSMNASDHCYAWE